MQTQPSLDTGELPSPSLIIYPERVKENIRHMITIAGDANRLRPHVKTHKLAEIVQLQIDQGIRKFKCATLAEARMLAESQADDILLAMQPVGPDIANIVSLAKKNPDTRFSTIADNRQTIELLDSDCRDANIKLGVYLDINSGMNRTGIAPDDNAVELYQYLNTAENLTAEGLHAYDGHIHESDPAKRELQIDRDFAKVEAFVQRLSEAGINVPNIIAGGTPSFPVHAKRNVDLSPGTTLLWDFGSSDKFKDLPFQQAALLFTRVISKPAPDLVCFDLGHKAVASEMEHPRVRIIGLEDATFVAHSEEHLVAKTDHASEIAVGDAYYAIPTHICPTVALHNKAAIAIDGKIADYWEIKAKTRI